MLNKIIRRGRPKGSKNKSKKYINFIQFCIADFLDGSSRLNPEQIGVYLLLLLALYVSKDGKLIDDDKVLARIGRCSAYKWGKIRPVLEVKFKIKKGFWRHARVDKELKRYRG